MQAWQKPHTWEFIVNRVYVPLSISINCFCTAKRYLDKVLPVKAPDLYALYKYDLFYGAGIMEKVANVQLEHFQKEGPRLLMDMAGRCEQAGARVLEEGRKVYQVEYARLDLKKLGNVYEDYCETLKSFSVFLNYPFSLEKFLDSELTSIVQKYVVDRKEATEWKKVLSEPIKFNEGQLEQLSLLKIAETISKRQELETINSSLSQQIDKHLDSYRWLTLRWFLGKPASREDIISRLTHLIEEGNISEKIRSLEEKPREIEKTLGEFLRKYHVPTRDEDMIRVVKEYVYIRTYRTDVSNRAFYFMIPMLEEIAKRFGIVLDDIIYLSSNEISKSLEKGALEKDYYFAERKKEWALFREKDSVFVLYGNDIENFGQAQGFITEDLKGIKELPGKVGFAGKMKGRVRVVLTPHDIQKVERGDILVTVMTFPSFIAAMEKAAAFVTDEGGILCHAAIVAREMKKPCVISTKIATKVLKDGDMVEVDADNGIVKKLS